MIHVHVDLGKNIKSVVESKESEGKQRICVRFDDATDVKFQYELMKTKSFIMQNAVEIFDRLKLV